MNLATALGISLAALTVAAYANPDARVFIRHGGPMANIDANNDGWITRTEASTGFERIFDDLDSNNDGQLTNEDRSAHFDVRIQRGASAPAPTLHGENCTQTVEPANSARPSAAGTFERRVTVICRSSSDEVASEDRRVTVLRGGDALSAEEHERIQREVERAMRDAEHAEREAEQLEREAERLAEQAERHVERHIVVINGDGHAPPVPGIAPMPPHPPMFMMLIANADEADTNGDGALSRDEFRSQHLRFFDASDANGDGRVRFEAPPIPPEPPAPPEAPQPPQPPRRG